MSDPSFLARFFEFGAAVVSHWLALVIGIAFVIEPFIESQIPEKWRNCLYRGRFGRPDTRRIWLRKLGAVFLFYACFQAFDDKSEQLRDAQKQLSNYSSQQAQVQAKPRHPRKISKIKYLNLSIINQIFAPLIYFICRRRQTVILEITQ